MKKLLTIATCLTATALLQSQTIIRVTLAGTGDGSSWSTASNLEAAISVAERSRSAGTEIWIQGGTYKPSEMLTVPASVKIYGGFSGTETQLSQRLVAANPTIIDGQQKIGSVFRLENAAELHGLTIQNGNAQGNLQKNGGGVWADENCVIANCIITDNTAILNGGGVYAKGKVEIINCIVKNNVAKGSGNDLFGNCLMMGADQSGGMGSGVDIAGCNPSILYLGEISFKTSKVWTISGNNIEQEWSDVVMAEGCEKAYFQGGVEGNYYSDCRSNNSTYGHLFSWCAVARFAHVLCPAPWRVPTKDDFINLDKALGGTGANNQSNNTTLRDKWGGAYGGSCDGSGSIVFQVSHVLCWSQTKYSDCCSYDLNLHSNGTVHPQNNFPKDYGLTLRCVK